MLTMKVILFTSNLFLLTSSHVNLFISGEEASRTLGLTTELSYVSDGVVNDYTAKYPFRVETNVSQLKLSWNSRSEVRYSLRVAADDFGVVPVLLIPSQGIVPLQIDSFTIEYRCVGMRAGQFEVSLYANFTYMNNDIVSVRIKQEKLCAAHGRRIGGDETSEDEEGSSLTTYILFLCAALFVILLAILFITYLCTSRKTNTDTSSTPRARLPLSFHSRSTTAQSQQPFLTSTPNKSWSNLSNKFKPFASTSPKAGTSSEKKTLPPVDVKSALVELHADKNLFNVLAFDDIQGTYGEIRWAIWRQTASGFSGDIDEDEDDGTGDEAMLVKVLKPNASQAQLERFLSDALVFHHVPAHTNLAKVAAVASFGRFDRPETVTDLPMVAYRHQGFGNLKKFLLSCNSGRSQKQHKDKTALNQTLRTHELVWIAMQISKALNHLHSYGIFHKDVATRNCIIAELRNNRNYERLHVQLMDSALSKDLFPADYHCLGDNNNRPIYWMAPEAYQANIFDASTDVWSFGMTLWELMTCATQPFAAVDPEDIQRLLSQGSRPPQPMNCPDQIYKIMHLCWQALPCDRLSALRATQMLQDFLIELTQYV